MFWLLGIFKAIIYGVVFYRAFQQTPLEMPVILLSVALVISGFLRNLYKYSRPKVNLVTLGLDLILAFLFSLVSPTSSFDKFFFVFLLEGVAVLPNPAQIYYGIAALAAGAGASVLYGFRLEGYYEPPGPAELLLYVLILVLVWGERRQREQRQVYKKMAEELRYSNLQLADSLKWSDRLAAEAERQRISGEIHDSLGHDLTGLILTLEAGKRLMQSDIEAAGGYWDKALFSARSAMQSVKELVGGKGPDVQFELVSFLKEMAERVEDTTELKVFLELPTTIPGLTVQEQFNLYRVLQEAVTNTLKHAGARQAKIAITVEPDGLKFSYEDDGRGSDMIEPGNGIKGMMSRMSAIGGTIDFNSAPGQGFHIEGKLTKRGMG